MVEFWLTKLWRTCRTHWDEARNVPFRTLELLPCHCPPPANYQLTSTSLSRLHSLPAPLPTTLQAAWLFRDPRQVLGQLALRDPVETIAVYLHPRGRLPQRPQHFLFIHPGVQVVLFRQWGQCSSGVGQPQRMACTCRHLHNQHPCHHQYPACQHQ